MPLLELPSFLLPTNSGQPMHSQSGLTELPSPNLAPFLLLNPVQHTAIVRPTGPGILVHLRYDLLYSVLFIPTVLTSRFVREPVM